MDDDPNLAIDYEVAEWAILLDAATGLWSEPDPRDRNGVWVQFNDATFEVVGYLTD